MRTKILMLSAFALAMLSAFGAKAQTPECNSNGYACIEVSGSAEKEVEPDTFYLQVTLNESDSKGRINIANQQRTMLSALKKCGIDTDANVTRLNLSSSFYNKKTNMSTASYQIKLNSAELVSSVWQTLDELGVSSVRFVKSECSALEMVKDELRAEAVRNAKHQAELMSDAVGQKVGKCIYIGGGYVSTPSNGGQIRLMKAAANLDMMSAEEESDNVLFTKIKVTANVNAKFLLL